MQIMLPSTSYSGRPVASFAPLRSHSGRGLRLTVTASTQIPQQFNSVAPVGDRVFVKIDKEEEKTTAGILLPTSAQKKPTQGEVVQAGASKAVKAGDKVVYSKYAGTEVSLGGQEHVVLKEEDVIGLLSSTNIADLKPLGDRVLIEVEEAERESQGGVLLTAASKEQPTIGKAGFGTNRLICKSQTLPWDAERNCEQKNGEPRLKQRVLLAFRGRKPIICSALTTFASPDEEQVVAVGSGKADDKGKTVKPSLSVGDTVLYSKYAGVEFEGNNDAHFIVVKDSDILASIA